MPKVGLFWGYQKRLYTHIVEVEQGRDDGVFVNGLYDHVDFWPHLVRKHRELGLFEYEDLPRGRVIYCKETPCYRIICDKKLRTESYTQQIIDMFELVDVALEFMLDLHYTTDPEALDALFSGDSQ
mgnify:CR=1 FL=1